MIKRRMRDENLNSLVFYVLLKMGNDFIKDAEELGIITCDNNGQIIDKKNKELKEYLENRGVRFMQIPSFISCYAHIAEWYGAEEF